MIVPGAKTDYNYHQSDHLIDKNRQKHRNEL